MCAVMVMMMMLVVMRVMRGIRKNDVRQHQRRNDRSQKLEHVIHPRPSRRVQHSAARLGESIRTFARS